ncbi:MAG: hypothetical protein DWQ40_00675 [Actinobacteria bacterium]|nr:MAG: hypothetical protein DWQ40_00675 [Actinomycetota bacterium]
MTPLSPTGIEATTSGSQSQTGGLSQSVPGEAVVVESGIDVEVVSGGTFVVVVPPDESPEQAETRAIRATKATDPRAHLGITARA